MQRLTTNVRPSKIATKMRTLVATWIYRPTFKDWLKDIYTIGLIAQRRYQLLSKVKDSHFIILVGFSFIL